MIRLCLGELATCGWQPFQAIHLVYYPREYFGVFARSEIMTLGKLFPLEVEAFHGIDLNQISPKHLEYVPTLMQYSQFTTDMLEAALGNSIPIDLSCSCFGEKNLLVVAMAVDRPDLASVAFLQGIRIPHGQRDLLLID